MEKARCDLLHRNEHDRVPPCGGDAPQARDGSEERKLIVADPQTHYGLAEKADVYLPITRRLGRCAAAREWRTSSLAKVSSTNDFIDESDDRELGSISRSHLVEFTPAVGGADLRSFRGACQGHRERQLSWYGQSARDRGSTTRSASPNTSAASTTCRVSVQRRPHDRQPR